MEPQTVSLSWREPVPAGSVGTNGTEYEIRYYEKASGVWEAAGGALWTVGCPLLQHPLPLLHILPAKVQTSQTFISWWPPGSTPTLAFSLRIRTPLLLLCSFPSPILITQLLLSLARGLYSAAQLVFLWLSAYNGQTKGRTLLKRNSFDFFPESCMPVG